MAKCTKTRHECIGTMLTMLKINSNIQKHTISPVTRFKIFTTTILFDGWLTSLPAIRLGCAKSMSPAFFTLQKLFLLQHRFVISKITYPLCHGDSFVLPCFAFLFTMVQKVLGLTNKHTVASYYV